MLVCDPMAYYYVVPCFLTAVFLASYWLVQALLWVFDFLNRFWDQWDEIRTAHPFVIYIEYAYLAGLVYYIVKWELSGST